MRDPYVSRRSLYAALIASLSMGCSTSAFDDLTSRDDVEDPSTAGDGGSAGESDDAGASASDAARPDASEPSPSADAGRPSPPADAGPATDPPKPDAGAPSTDAGTAPSPRWPDPTVANESAIDRIRDVYVEWCDVKQTHFSGAVCRVFSDARITAATRAECAEDIRFACGTITKPVILCDRPSSQCVSIEL